ncbi:MAG: LLM class oxidoreductase, partial [Bacteroidota bacterium]
KHFEQVNPGYNRVFKAGKLSLGIVVPIEHYSQSAIPTMSRHLERVKLVEQLGFEAIWTRDVPFQVPSFGDAGQTFDPFTYLGFLAGQTSEITLGVASIALPLHHPLHIAKSAATIDQLSQGRFVMGIASGDRAEEYPAMSVDYQKRDQLFRDSFQYIRAAQEPYPKLEDNTFGQLSGLADILPKPHSSKIPLLVTGYSRQSLEWNARYGDGWIYYPRSPMQQAYIIAEWRRSVDQFHQHGKPFMQPLYVILEQDDDFKPQPIQLGLRTGANYLMEYLQDLERMGVNHVAINLRFNYRDTEKTLEELANKILPSFKVK